MSLILHHALKDLRAQRWLVAAWAVALLALCAVDAFQPDLLLTEPGRRRTTSADPIGYALLAAAMLRALLSWLIAIRVVHADPLDSTDAFWLTRPLSLRTLFAAKAGLIGTLFVVAPAAAVAVALLGNGIPAAAVPALVLRWLLIDLVLLLPVVLVATLTRDLARVVILLAVMLWAWFLLQVATSRAYHDGAYSELIGNGTAIATAWIGTLAFVAAATAALIAWHYLTRQRRNTAMAAAAAIVLCTGLAWAWPIQLQIAAARDARGGRSWIKEWNGGEQVELEIAEDGLRPLARSATTDVVVGDIRVKGLEDRVVFDTMSGGKASLSFPGTEPFLSREVYWRAMDTFPGVTESEDNRQVVERLIGARLIDQPALAMNRGWAGVELMQLPSAAYGLHQGTPGTYEADLNLMARRVSVAAAIPFVRGASAQLGDLHTAIADIRETTHRVPSTGGALRYFVVELSTSAPRTLSTRTIGRTGYLLLNRRRGEAVPLLDGSVRLSPTEVGTLAAFGVWNSRRELIHRIGGESASPDEARWLDKAWLAEAELVFLSSEILGKFTRHVSVPDFTLPPLHLPR